MAGFVYFARGLDRDVTPQDLSEWGLDYVNGPGLSSNEVTRGPNGQGMLFADASRLGKFAAIYAEDAQEWELLSSGSEGGQELHVGYFKASPPTPNCLLRDSALLGHQLKLADGRNWTVPVARSWSSLEPPKFHVSLPQRCRYDAARGDWVTSGVIPQYERLWEIAERFIQHLSNQAREAKEKLEAEGEEISSDAVIELNLDFGEELELGTEVLGFNYALGKVEAGMLDLFRTDYGSREVLLALIDQPTFDDLYQKKTGKARDGSPT